MEFYLKYIEDGEKKEGWLDAVDAQMIVNDCEEVELLDTSAVRTNLSGEDLPDFLAGVLEFGEAFDYYANDVGVDFAWRYFSDAFCGEYSSLEHYAEEVMPEIYSIPDNLLGYIDYKQFAYDLSLEGYTCEGGFVFRPV